MRTEFPMNDPRNIWKNQPTEGFKMSVDELHRKAQQRQKKARFEALFSIIIGLMLFVLFACDLREETPGDGSAHRVGPDESLVPLFRLSGIQMDLAEAACT